MQYVVCSVSYVSYVYADAVCSLIRLRHNWWEIAVKLQQHDKQNSTEWLMLYVDDIVISVDCYLRRCVMIEQEKRNSSSAPSFVSELHLTWTLNPVDAPLSPASYSS